MKINKNIAVSDSGFMFNPGTGESYSVNPIGIRIFELLKQDKSVEEINKTILNEFEISPTTCEKDVSDFIGHLQHYQLVEDSTKS